MVIPGKGNDVTQRICSVDGCERKHVAKGLCCTHYNRERYSLEQRHPKQERVCIQCGQSWRTAQAKAKYCSVACKGDAYRRSCKLPADHPVRVEMKRQAEAATRTTRAEAQAQRLASWRTPRECPGCGCSFSPLYTPTMLTCSKRCARRVQRWRRRASEAQATGSFIWSDFMRIAQRFDFKCAYCNVKPQGQLDPDHVVPLSRGGYNSTANLLPACRACNADKRDLLLNEWNADRERRGKPPRVTSWTPEDRRFRHLTQALLAA